MERRINQFVLNRYKVPIKKCCASCKHAQPDTEFRRKCDNGEGSVNPKSVCLDWEMREGLDNAGKGGGKLHKWEFLQFIADYPWPKKGERVDLDKWTSNAIAEWEAKNGSRFLTDF